MTCRRPVAAVDVGIDQAANHLVVDVVRGIRPGRIEEITVRRYAPCPFGQQGIDLIAAGRIAGHSVESREAGNDLAEDVELVGTVPATEVLPRRRPPRPLAKAFEEVVVGDAEILVVDLVQLHPHPAAVESHAAVVERLKPPLPLDSGRFLARRGAP